MAMELDVRGALPLAANHSDHNDSVNVAETTPPATGLPTGPQTIVPLETGNVVHLAAGVDLSHPVQIGNDLEFVQPDGSIILIPNGAVAGLTIYVGGVEIPADTLAAIFSANDIQPAEGGQQGNAQGGHQFNDPGPGGIGDTFPLTALLPPTELNFGPPDTQQPRFPVTGDHNHAPFFSGEHGNQHIHAVTLFDVSEEGLPGGNKDSNPDAARDTTDAATSSGTFGVTDQDGDPLFFSIGTPLEALKSGGQALEWSGVGTNTLIGSLPGGGAEIIRITINDGTVNDGQGEYTVTLKGPIDHPDTTVEDVKTIHFDVTVSDGKGGTDTATFALGIEDDSPTVTVTAQTGKILSGLGMELDETVGTDRYNTPGETGATDTNKNTDDDTTPPTDYLGRVTTTIAGGLAALFTVGGTYGADGAGGDTGTLSFSGLPTNHTPVATNLLATQGGAISLVYVSGTVIEGRDNSGTGDVVFKIEIVNNQLQTTLYEAINHGQDGNAFDSNKPLQLVGDGAVQLSYSVTRVDADGDSATDKDSIDLISKNSSTISFDDDGPKLVGGEIRVTGEVDEDGLTGANADDGRTGETTGTNSASFTSTNVNGALSALVDFGSDGKGSFGLISTASPVDSGLTSDHETVLIVSDGTTLHGYVDNDGVAGFGGTDRDVFTLTVTTTGNYTFTLHDQIDHPTLDGAAGDNTENLLTSGIDLSGFVQATDGDGDSTVLGSGTFVVQVRDDIPVLTARDATSSDTTTTTTLAYSWGGGNKNILAVDGQDDHDIKVTATTGGTIASVNSSNHTIGVDDADLDGFAPGKNNKPDTGPDVIKLDFVNSLVVTNQGAVQSSGAAYSVHATSFAIDVAEAHQGEAAVVFVSAVDVGNNPVALTFTIDPAVVPALTPIPVVNGSGTIVGYVLDGVPDNATVTATGANGALFDHLEIGNYDGFQFDTTGHVATTFSDGNPFKITDIESSTSSTVTVNETFRLAIDETAGVNTAPDPNAADDVDPTQIVPPADLGGAAGYARSAASVTDSGSLFTGKVGADAPGGYSFAITNAQGAALSNVDSGLKTLNGDHIMLTTNGSGVLEGKTAAGTVFKVEVDGTGHLWIAQYQPIANDLAGSTQAAYDDIARVTADLHIKATLTDEDGDSVSAVSPVSLQIEFQDDGPKANDDVDGVDHSGLIATGNVITGIDHSNGDLNTTDGVADVKGTDGAKITEIAGAGGESSALDNNHNITIGGQYGTLVINENGDYTYTRSDGAPLTASDVFTYTLTDGDGDFSTASLTISITDNGATLSNLTSSANGGDATVYEADLLAGRGQGESDGSHVVKASTTVTGNFTISVPDGVGTLTVNGTPVDASALTNSGTMPVAITTPLGNTLTITGYNSSTGVVSYSYTLLDNETHSGAGADSLYDNLAVSVTDSDGDSASSTLSIKIVDDVPTANPDGPATPAEDTLININVFSNDVAGADGVNLTTGIALTTGPTHGTATYKDDGTFDYTPTPGATGSDSFTYTITDKDGDTSTATVSITLAADSKPSVVSASSLEVDEDGFQNAAVDTQTARTDETDSTESTKDLTGTAKVTFGHDVPTSANLLASIVLNDAPALDGQLHTLDGQSVTFAKVGNDLVGTISGGLTEVVRITITGASVTDPTTGEVTYTYSATLSQPIQHGTDPVPENAAMLNNIGFTVTDSDGSTASSSFNLKIVDDVPQANANNSNVTEGASVSGNVLTDGTPDVFGADGPATTKPAGGVVGVRAGDDTTTDASGGLGVGIPGAHGTLTLNADGTYTYQATADGITADTTDVFVYTIQDGDGDTSTTTLTIHLADVTIHADANSADVTVYEKALDTVQDPGDLAPGTVTGSLPSSPLETDSTGNQLTSSGGTPTLHYALVGSANGSYGTIQINDDGTFVYTLTKNDLNPTIDDGVKTIPGLENFTYKVTDANGNTATGTIHVNIVDDVPTAVADTDTVQSGGTAVGNVITDAEANGDHGADSAGADGIASIAWANASGSTVAGMHGTLTFDVNGGYSYKAAPNSSGTEQFSYTITDGDGDTSTTTLTITVTDGSPHPVAASRTVDEAALDQSTDSPDITHGTVTGSNPTSTAETVTGKLTLGDPDNPLVTHIAGVTASDVAGIAVTINGSYGVLQIDQDGNYTYTLTKPYETTPDSTITDTQAETGKDVFTYTVTDALGNTQTSTISIDIKDDVPTANADTKAAVEGATVNGNVLTGAGADVFGADGPASTTPTGGVIGVRAAGLDTTTAVTTGTNTDILGLHGTLHLNADGSYSYTSLGNSISADTTDVFVYTIQDGDGDRSTTTLTINLSDVQITAPDDSDVIVYEKALDTTALPDGADLAVGTVTGSLPGSALETDASNQLTAGGNGSGTLHYALVTGGNTTTAGTYGSIKVNDDGSYVYTLTKNYLNTNANDSVQTIPGAESFTYKVTDGSGNTATGTILISIVDDVPTATNDTWASTITGQTTITGLFANDVFGADGVDTANTTPGQVTATDGAHGTVVYNNNGTFTYTPTGVYNGADSFTYTITDKDGDKSTATVNLNVNTNSVPTGGGTAAVTVSEAALDTVQDAGPPADLATGVVTGTNPSSRGETGQATTGITFNATGEALTVAFANPTDNAVWLAPTVTGLAAN